MPIADQVLTQHTESFNALGYAVIKDYDLFVADCESKAVSVDQDIDNESTIYAFSDRSCILWCNSYAIAYGSVN